MRIYVERAIKGLKDFRIVNQTIPITIPQQANDIIIIYTALTNMRGRLQMDGPVKTPQYRFVLSTALTAWYFIMGM